MKGFTIIELMIVATIFFVVLAAVFNTLATGRVSWQSGSAQIQAQEEVRKGMDGVVKELRESASSKATITGGGTIITFQVPVDYDNDGTWDDKDEDEERDKDEYIWDLTNDSGEMEWGAPLHLHCRNPLCESEGNLYNTCHYNNYEIRYLVSNGRLLRRVFDGTGYESGSKVREDILANNINALMFVGSPTANPAVISIEITAEKGTVQGRTIQSTLHSQVTLRNLRN